MSHDRSGQYDYMDVDDFEELIDGRVVKMMVGSRWQHNVIIENLAGAMRRRFRAQGSDCRTFSKMVYIKAPGLKTSTLPDIIVRCGRLAESATSLDDPKVLIEVVSPGSEGLYRVEKWKAYQKLASLEHYVLVERDRAAINVFDPTGDAWAVRRMIEGLEAELSLPAVNVSIPLQEIYEDVFSP